MNNLAFERWSLIACLVGLLMLLALSIAGVVHLRDEQTAGVRLLALDSRLDAFILSSHELLHHEADAESLSDYRRDAAAIRTALREIAGDDLALKASGQVAAMVDLVTAARSELGEGPAGDGSTSRSSVDIDAIADELADYNSSLESVLDRRLANQFRSGAREAWWIGGGLIGLSLVFGLLSLLAFFSIHWRITRPARALIDTLEAVRSGNANARAEVTSGRGLGKLARTLNATLDELGRVQKASEKQARQIERANADLQAARDQLVRAQQIGSMGSWEVVYPEEKVSWSRQALQILGDQPAAVGGTIEEFLRRVHPDDRERLRVEREEWLQSGGEFESNYRVVRDDGKTVWLHARAQLTKATDGSIVYSTGTLQDVSELREQQKWLRIMEELLEGSEDLCGIFDPSGRYQWVNRAYSRAYKRTAADFIGQSAKEVLGETYFEAEVRPRLDRTLAGHSSRFETTRTLPGGDRRRLLANYYPIDLPGESVRYVGFVITDVTDIRAAQDRMEEQSRLLDITGRMTRFGGWSVDLVHNRITWSPVTAEIHGRPPGYSPSIEEGIEYYAPEYRDRIRACFEEVARSGGTYDEIAEIIDANGNRLWVRAIAEARHNESGEVVEVHGAFGDITDFKKLEQERARLASQLAEILESVTDGFVALDRQWKYVYVNAEAGRLTGRRPDELLGTSIWEQFPEVADSSTGKAMRKAMDDHQSASAEEFNEPLDAWFETRMYPREDGIAMFFRNVSEHHQLLDRLRDQESELRASRDAMRVALQDRQALINSLPAHIAMLDGEGTVIDVNDQWRYYGRSHGSRDPAFGVGTNYLSVCRSATGDCGESAQEIEAGLRRVLTGDIQQFDLEYPCHSPDREQWFRVVFNRLHGGNDSPGAVAMHVDVTERKLAEQDLERVAFEDPLTGMLSRVGFERRLRNWLDQDGWNSGGIVLTFDIVRLRDINEAHGYDIGDRVLVELSRRVRDRVGPNGLVGRLAGDEFAAYIDAVPTASAEAEVQDIGQSITTPFDFDTASIALEVNLGYTLFGDRERGVKELIREAEVALFESVSNPSETQCVRFNNTLDERSRERIRLTDDMRRALASDEFQLHFQPKVDLSNGHVIAAEALLRWQHPEHGLMPPGRFIPVAEQSQLIGPLGRWALRDACRHLQHWQKSGVDLVRVSVNVSLVQLLVGDFTAEVKEALEDFNVSPDALSLEITESVFERESDRMRKGMYKLRDLGVRLSLDDFGTGYSSLQYLQRYPFDEIKVDRAFTDGILTNRFSRDIVLSVLKIAEAIGAEVVAEGIESREIADELVRMGCRIGQGYYYSVPLEAEDFYWLLERHSALPLAIAPTDQ